MIFRTEGCHESFCRLLGVWALQRCVMDAIQADLSVFGLTAAAGRSHSCMLDLGHQVSRLDKAKRVELSSAQMGCCLCQEQQKHATYNVRDPYKHLLLPMHISPSSENCHSWVTLGLVDPGEQVSLP